MRMMSPVKSFFKGLLRCYQSVHRSISEVSKQPLYRIVSIDQDETENYIATIQVTNKSHTFKMKPEEILADDHMTDAFSPRDIRTLTYLGYLGINAPKYKVLAKRLSDNDAKLVFALQVRGQKKPVIRTADEISTDEDLIAGLDQKDAHLIGYTSASEREALEKAQMKKLLAQKTQAIKKDKTDELE